LSRTFAGRKGKKTVVHTPLTSHIVSGTVSKLWKLFWKLFGKKRKKRTKSEQKMSTISEILESATPEILGSATRPASAMGQIDPAPPAELVDAVSASPLEPFANPDAARKEPGEEPTMPQNVERPGGGAARGACASDDRVQQHGRHDGCRPIVSALG
jgi:hypothetical protein